MGDLRGRIGIVCLCAIAAVAARALLKAQTPAKPPASVSSIRVLFGLTDAEPTVWNGTVALSAGTVKAIQGWRFGPEDSTDYSTSWKAATRAQGTGPDMVLENGVLITAEAAPDARWSLHTPKGDFSFTLHDVPWGDRKTFLDGAVAVDRVPPTSQLTTSDDDEDFPSIARRGDRIRMSFVRFSHSDRSLESAAQIPKPPDNFSFLSRPAGGDQVFVMTYASGAWSEPVAVSRKGEDIARTAIAIDGQNRTWVIWSAQRNGNFDLFARVSRDGTGGSQTWDPEIRITSDAGPDLNPVAATDANGRVWIAWQGFRNDNLTVLAAVQAGDTFGPEETISVSPASNWDPVIAASSNGEVAVAWDTYGKGDYDVYLRRLNAAAEPAEIVKMEPVPVAATDDFEARASIAYDIRNRLWVAYEVSSPRWGKNFGAFETTGSPLYEDRSIRIRCFDNDTAFTTSSDLTNVLPGPPAALRRAGGTRSNRVPLAPNPNLARNRRPNQNLGPRNAALNSSPQLAADPAGGIYLAFRSLDGPFNARSPVGSVWFEHVVYFDGHNWVGPVFLPRTDGLLENKPALVALEPGRLLAVSAMDHRQSIPAQGLGPNAADRINADLYSADLRLDGLNPPSPKPELMKLQREAPGRPDPKVAEERAQVALVRNYRIEAGGEQLRILRGDMHRHTEYSVDGARDGSLEDAYRYLIDGASLDWAGCCDNENGGGHEYFWWLQQKTADEYKLGDRFIPMFAYEHAVRYPEGHRNVLFAKRGIRPVPHLAPVPADAPPAPAPDTQMLYKYLAFFGGISVPHTTATDLGTDWRDNDPAVEPVVEIYQGDRQSYEKEDAPRAAKAGASLNGWKPLGAVTAALDKGYWLGFIASSDHYSTHISFANVLVSAPGREAIVDAFRKRHVYASTDNIVAEVRSGDHIMGDRFSVSGTPSISVKLIGTAPFAKVTIVKDGQDAYVVEPRMKEVGFTWRDDAAQTGKSSYYYVRGEQTDGQLVWVSPMWITLQ